jgi:hypothetical protein
MTLGRAPDPPDLDLTDSTLVSRPLDHMDWDVVQDEPRCKDSKASIAQWRGRFDPGHWVSDDDIAIREVFPNRNGPHRLTISVRKWASIPCRTRVEPPETLGVLGSTIAQC